MSRLAVIQKEHTPEKWEARKPYNWKQQWGPYLKYDADWDSAYFFDLIIYKLEKMYLELDIFSNEYKPTLTKKLKILDEIIKLGKKIQTFDYFEESDRFSKAHCAHVVLIYDNEGKKGMEAMLSSKKLLAKVPSSRTDTLDEDFSIDDIMGDRLANQWIAEHGYTKSQVHYAYSGEWDSEENQKAWVKMIKAEGKAKQKETDQFFKMISRNFRDWWW